MPKAMQSILPAQADPLRGGRMLWEFSSRSILSAVSCSQCPCPTDPGPAKYHCLLWVLKGVQQWRHSAVRDSDLPFGIAWDNLDQNDTREMWRWMGFIPIRPTGIPRNDVAKVLKAQGGLCWLSVLQLT